MGPQPDSAACRALGQRRRVNRVRHQAAKWQRAGETAVLQAGQRCLAGQRPVTSQPRASPRLSRTPPWDMGKKRTKPCKGGTNGRAPSGLGLSCVQDPGRRSCLACPGLACAGPLALDTAPPQPSALIAASPSKCIQRSKECIIHQDAPPIHPGARRMDAILARFHPGAWRVLSKARCIPTATHRIPPMIRRIPPISQRIPPASRRIPPFGISRAARDSRRPTWASRRHTRALRRPPKARGRPANAVSRPTRSHRTHTPTFCMDTLTHRRDPPARRRDAPRFGRQGKWQNAAIFAARQPSGALGRSGAARSTVAALVKARALPAAHPEEISPRSPEARLPCPPHSLAPPPAASMPPSPRCPEARRAAILHQPVRDAARPVGTPTALYPPAPGWRDEGAPTTGPGHRRTSTPAGLNPLHPAPLRMQPSQG